MKSTTYIPYMLMFLAVVATMNCIKHILRLGYWNTLSLIVVKDVTVAILTIYLFRFGRRSINTPGMNRICGIALWAVLTISMIGDWALAVV